MSDKLKSGCVESIENIDLFYHNKHYELVVPLVHTNEQYSSEVGDKDVHPECDSIYRNKTFADSVYLKQRPNSTGETMSYLHEYKLLPIMSEQIKTFKYRKGLQYINRRERQ